MASQSDNVTASTAACVENWLPFAEQQIRAIEELPDGWDSEGAGRPDSRTVRAGLDLLGTIFTAVCVPKPHINPTPSGGVQFDWESGGRYFELEIIDSANASYYFEDEKLGEAKSGALRFGQPHSEFVRLLDRLIA